MRNLKALLTSKEETKRTHSDMRSLARHLCRLFLTMSTEDSNHECFLQCELQS